MWITKIWWFWCIPLTSVKYTLALRKFQYQIKRIKVTHKWKGYDFLTYRRTKNKNNSCNSWLVERFRIWKIWDFSFEVRGHINKSTCPWEEVGAWHKYGTKGSSITHRWRCLPCEVSEDPVMILSRPLVRQWECAGV